MISPRLRVEVFKPYYERIFSGAKRRGMHTYLHSCGNITAILGDLIDAGLDIIQIDAPHQNGVPELHKHLSEIYFDCCIDIKRVLVTCDKSQIEAEARLLTSQLGCSGGGFIVRQYPQVVYIGVAPEVNDVAYNAFKKLGPITQHSSYDTGDYEIRSFSAVASGKVFFACAREFSGQNATSAVFKQKLISKKNC